MAKTDQDPDRRLLEDFILGRLPDADTERVAARLADDPRWLELTESLSVTDPLLEAVRGAADKSLPEDTPPLRDLMARLERLSRSPSLTATCDIAGETPSPTLPTSGADGLSFLRPAQTHEELGRLAGFRILEILGKGGMGLVFQAEDVQLHRQVALKVIKPEHCANAHHRERFLREARAAAQIQSDHVMPVLQIGEDNDVLFLAMPLLGGETLEARLSRENSLTLKEQLNIGREIALGLAAAHARGLIHRDIKPSNIWLESNSVPEGQAAVRVKILDFGLVSPARGAESLTHTGAVLGTPSYMSPEQVDGNPVDGRSDLFSLGVVMYRMATGKQPFQRNNLSATLRAVVDHTPEAPLQLSPELPAGLSHLIQRLMAKSPDERPASAAATANAILALDQGSLTNTAFVQPAPRKSRRYWTPVAIGAALLVGVLAFVAVGLWSLGVFAPARFAALATATSKSTGREPPTEKSPSSGTMIETGRSKPAGEQVYRGHVDAIVWTKTGGAPGRLRLSDEGALPLQVGDQIRIAAAVTPKAYLYLFWIDTEGKVAPIYPWEPGKWGTRPTEESPREELSLPTLETKGYKITGDRGGMETLLLLAREKPLEDDDAAVQDWFAGVQPQRPVQDARSAVWFENSRVVKNDERFVSRGFEETVIDDPVLRMQELLRVRLHPHASFTSAVSFAKQGKR